jgi:hypothetical protein
MQGHHDLARCHIQSGVKLFSEIVYDQQTGAFQHQVLGSQSHVESYASIDVLAKIFARLDPQSCNGKGDILLSFPIRHQLTRVGRRIGGYQFQSYGSIFSGTTFEVINFNFSSIEEAKDIFEYGCHVFASSNAMQVPYDQAHLSAAIEARICHFTSLMSRFSLALQAFIEARSPPFTPKEDAAASVLQLHVLSAYISFFTEHLPPNYRPHWHTLMPQFTEMVLLGEKIVSFISPGNHHSFCSDLGFIIPLYTVANLCQDRGIRKRIITLLRSTWRQEGLWNSMMIAKAIEKIMEIEDSVLGEVEAYTNGPDDAIPSIQPFLELDGKGGRWHYVRPDQGSNTPIKVVEEVFNW